MIPHEPCQQRNFSNCRSSWNFQGLKKNVGPPFPYTFPIPLPWVSLGFMGRYIREAYENGSLTVGWGIPRSRIPLFSILHLWNLTWSPKNYPIEQEYYLPNFHYCVQHVNFPKFRDYESNVLFFFGGRSFLDGRMQSIGTFCHAKCRGSLQRRVGCVG